jgi:hypothetical protein
VQNDKIASIHNGDFVMYVFGTEGHFAVLYYVDQKEQIVHVRTIFAIPALM